MGELQLEMTGGQAEREAAGQKLINRFDEVPYIGRKEGGELVYGQHYLEQTPRWLDAVYDSSLDKVSEDMEISEAQKYIQYVMGAHWPSERPSYRPKPVVNKIAKFFWENIANLTDVKLNMNVRTENQTLQNTAKILTKAAQANYHAMKGNIALIFTVMHAMLSIGATKVGYDWSEEDVSYLPCGSDTLIPILGNQFDFQKSAGCVYRSWKPLAYFRERFPGRANLVHAESVYESSFKTDRPFGVDEYTWNSLAPSFREFLYANQSSDHYPVDPAWSGGRVPIAMLNEFWFHDPQINTSDKEIVMGAGNWSYRVPPRHRLYPFGRVIITAHQTRRVILYDQPNYHWHGCFPFAVLRTQPVPWMWSGISDFRDLWPIQDTLNKSLSDGLGLLNQSCNPTVVTKEGSMSPATWANYFPGMPRAKINLINRMEPVGNQISWITPPIQALAVVPQFAEWFTRAFYEQSGQMDASRLVSKKQVPSGDTIEQIRDSQMGKYRIKGIFIESYFQDLGRLVLSDIVQFYSRKKCLSVLGPDALTWDYFDYDPESIIPKEFRGYGSGPFERGREFVKNFKAMMAPGSALPQQRRENAQLALGLWKMRAIDLESLYEILTAAGYNLPQAKTVLLRMQEEAPFMPQPAKKGGGGHKSQAA